MKNLKYFPFARSRYFYGKLLTVDDFEQEGYFAVQYAAEHYDPGKGFAFSTWLAYAMQRQIDRALTGGHRLSVTDADGKQHTVSADPLNHCASLDVPLTDDTDTTLGDTIADESAGMEQAEETIYRQQLHADLDTALDKLTDAEQAAIRARFYENKSIRETGEQLGVTPSRARTLESNGLRKLRMNPRLMRYREEYIRTHAWHGTGFATWNHSGSVQERTVEGLERLYDRQKAPETTKNEGVR